MASTPIAMINVLVDAHLGLLVVLSAAGSEDTVLADDLQKVQEEDTWQQQQPQQKQT